MSDPSKFRALITTFLVVASALEQYSCRSLATDSEVKIENGAGAGEGAGAETDISLDMNDVSILMPIFLVKDLYGKMPAVFDKPNPKKFAPGLPSSAEDGEGFIPADTAKALAAIFAARSTSSTFDSKTFSDFRLLSIRIDGCANQLRVKSDEYGSKCEREMRLVWGKVRFFNTFQSTADSNLHTIYSLEKSELQAIVSTLRRAHKAASIDTKNMPLSPHPVIAKEGLDSAYLKSVLGLVHRYVRASKMTRIASMEANGSGSEWQFVQGTVKDKKITEAFIPTLEPKDATFLESVRQASPREVDFDFWNRSTSEFDIPTRPTRDKEAPLEVRKTRVKNAFAIDNPRLHDVTSINCSNCHRTFDTVKDQLSLQRDGQLVIPNDAFKSSRWNLKNTTDSERVFFSSLQAFGYTTINEPKIIQRTINESAQILDFLIAQGYVVGEVEQAILPVSPVEEGVAYRLVSQYSDKCLTATKVANGSLLEQNNCSDARSFVFKKKADGSYTMAVSDSPKICLDIKDGSKAKGTAIQLWECNGKSQQNYSLDGEASQLTIASTFSGLCLDVAGPSKDSGAKLQQWDCQSSPNQTWTLQRADGK